MPLNLPPEDRPPWADDDTAPPAAMKCESRLSWIHVEAVVLGALVLLGAASMLAGWLE